MKTAGKRTNDITKYTNEYQISQRSSQNPKQTCHTRQNSDPSETYSYCLFVKGFQSTMLKSLLHLSPRAGEMDCALGTPGVILRSSPTREPRGAIWHIVALNQRLFTGPIHQCDSSVAGSDSANVGIRDTRSDILSYYRGLPNVCANIHFLNVLQDNLHQI